jgi:DNA-binding CsgD family transcriptional regulator
MAREHVGHLAHLAVTSSEGERIGILMYELNQDLLAAIYGGPLESEPWSTFTDMLRAILDATAVALVLVPSTTERIETSVRSDAKDCKFDWVALNLDYNKHYIDIDPTAIRDHQSGEYRDIADYRDSRYYSDFLQPLGIHHAFRVRFSAPGGMLCWISAARMAEECPFEQKTRKLMQEIRPHMERAMTMFSQLKVTENKAMLYHDMTSHLNIGVVLINENGRSIELNDVAKQLIDTAGVLAIQCERLIAKTATDNSALQDSIGHVLAQRSAGHEAVKLCRFATDKGKIISALLRTVPRQTYFHGEMAPAVVVYLTKLDINAGHNCGRTTSQRLISELFGLTPTESRLALLMADGKSLVEIADELSISEKTARNHSKNIYDKTGIRRQANLVRLIHQSVVLLG